MGMAQTQHFNAIIDQLKRAREQDVGFPEVIALAEIVTHSLQTFVDSVNATVYRELHEIADYIEAMKKEIGALQANEIQQNRIPDAGQELGAIVEATEQATNTIMECAETLMAADASDPAAYKALVDEKMMVIFEACSFQDITGQRIAKVVATLEHIETRVARFASAMRAKDDQGHVDDQERVRAERRERLMLNGPQLKGQGIAQDDIDTLLRDKA